MMAAWRRTVLSVRRVLDAGRPLRVVTLPLLRIDVRAHKLHEIRVTSTYAHGTH
jgi:hypothetical protein